MLKITELLKNLKDELEQLPSSQQLFEMFFPKGGMKIDIRAARKSCNRTNVRAIIRNGRLVAKEISRKYEGWRHIERARDAQEDSCALPEGRRESWIGGSDHRAFSPRFRNEQEWAVCSFSFQTGS